MATNLQFLVEKQMIPFSKLNGFQSYRDYGWAILHILDTTPAIPTPIGTFLVPSGDEMTVYQPGRGLQGVVPSSFSHITGELTPIIRDGAEYKEPEATGMIE